MTLFRQICACTGSVVGMSSESLLVTIKQLIPVFILTAMFPYFSFWFLERRMSCRQLCACIDAVVGMSSEKFPRRTGNGGWNAYTPTLPVSWLYYAPCILCVHMSGSDVPAHPEVRAGTEEAFLIRGQRALHHIPMESQERH